MGLLGDLWDSTFDGVLDVTFGTLETVCDTANVVKSSVIENPGKAMMMGIAALATGGAALSVAPTIGAAASAAGLGVGGGTLSGAAASSAGLAALGGGSLAAGGAGMVGGTAVITVTGALSGGALAGTVISTLPRTERD
ncbi:hypothetical protein [Budvicia aquatica]|uniref:Uncharacterized protein n=1 Tax=Budvicia aquatica TaxID=82979 RepID=A0A2C6DIX6_9GAMM|nr:hypothetical protein [Budvicia aquatica]PHI28282.1 hypothetical protein CRN84_02490 [Budvicia aquatica]VFS46170.1 Uncharacterised protein [Budvicia aquatica]